MVRRSQHKFSAVSGDMALELSLNKDVRYDGGLNGKAYRDMAKDKCFLTSHFNVAVSFELNATAQGTHINNKIKIWSAPLRKSV